MNFETLTLIRKENYSIIQLDNGKVNAIDNNLALELKEVFNLLEADEKTKGIILTGRDNCFSAGLDIVNLLQGGIEGAEDFLNNYLGLLQTMIKFPKPFVCAITGYAPAGATMLACCADYRVMAKGEKHVIGMHEFRFSMQMPELLCDIYTYVLGEKRAWKAVQQASLFNSDQALSIGLVDESVETGDVLPRAERHLKKLLSVHGPVFIKTKKYLRKDFLKYAEKPLEPMIKEALADWDEAYIQTMVDAFVGSLKKK